MGSRPNADVLERKAFRYLGRSEGAKALDCLQKALAVREATLGGASFDVANTLTVMAGIQALHQQDYEAAAPLWRRAIAVYEQLYHAKLGSGDSAECRDLRRGLRGNLENLAVYAHGQGRYSDAVVLFTRAAELAEEGLGSLASGGICNIELYSDALVKQAGVDQPRGSAGQSEIAPPN
jgi:tetratricopeptide (TPR) repeat protein